MTTGQPWRVRVWLPVVAGLALVFAFVIPWLPSLAATERPVVPGERVFAQTASFAPADGWTLDLEAASNSRPQVSLDAVTVRLSDGVWFGTTADLLERLGEQLREAGASVGPLPDAPTDDSLLTVEVDAAATVWIPRAEYEISFTLGDDTGRLFVVREDVGVALLRSVGPEAELESRSAEIGSMEASVDTGVVSVDTVPTEPR